MIRKIEFSNFYSFKEKQTIDFLTSKKRSEDYGLSSIDGKQIVTVAGVVSKNAAGKTNLMRVFGFLNAFVLGYNPNKNLEVAYKTFFNNKESSNFSVEFEAGGSICVYSFVIKNYKVYSESLIAGKDVVYEYTFNKGPVVNGEYGLEWVTDKFAKDFKRNDSFFSVIKKSFDNDFLDKVSDELLFGVNINESGKTFGEQFMQEFSSKYYLDNQEIKLEMENFINNFDLGPKREFQIDVSKKDGVEKIDIFTRYIFGSKTKKLPFIYESTGTRMIYYMLFQLFVALRDGGVLIVDEIETGLHPEALNKLIQYFIDENKSGAQLVFSTHNLDFLKKFNKDQVFLVDKNERCESVIMRLDKSAPGRTEDNLYNKYNSGMYGAYPDITI